MNILQRRRFTSLLKSTTNTLRKSRSLLRLVLLVGLMPIAALALGSSSSAANVFGPLFARIFDNSQARTETKVDSPLSSASTEYLSSQDASSTMSVERRGHTATRLSDGRVLIAGGENSSGTLNGTEIYDPATATFSAAGNMNTARADQTATLLSDGRVLIAGGRNGAGAQATTEIFDPATGTFASGPQMGVARTGHSATLFTDGRIMFAGGDAVGSAEILDATLSNFTATGSMNAARSMHSAALLQDGHVLIVGGHGTDANAVLSGEIFDTASGSFSTVAGTLTVARVRAHLRVLFDGKVQIIGGGNDGSMEIYDPSIATFGAYSHVLPETDTCTNLRPGILAAQTRAALFHNGQSDEMLDRSGYTITELGSSALVVGGTNSSQVVLSSSSVLPSSSASISTDKLDYYPGETAVISGRGFQAGETVRVKMHEDPHTPQERGFDVVADGDGNFVGEYLVQQYDLATKFITSARGLTSGATAHTTFTDAPRISATVAVGAQSASLTYGTAGSATFTVLATRSANGTVNGTTNITSVLPAGVTATYSSPNPWTAVGGTAFPGTTITITTSASSPAGTFPFTVRVADGSDAGTGTGTLTIGKASSTTTITCGAGPFTYDGTAKTPCSATATGAGGLNVSVPVVYGNNTNAGTATADATYAGDTNHSGSTASQATFTIDKASSSTTITCGAGPFIYDGTAKTPCSATATGAGGLNTPVTVVYANNTNAGTATADATYAGDTNHHGSNATQVTFTIDKAASSATINCPSNVTYTGSALEPCTATTTGAGGLNVSVTVVYANNTNAGTATADATYAGDTNHDGSNATQVSFTIDKAASSTTINCPSNVTYTGSALEPCTATATGAGGLNVSVTVVYANNTNAGTATADASYAGDANHHGSNATQVSFTIDKAASSTTINCPSNVTYTGSALEPCSATATGAGGLNISVTVVYANNTNAGTATADATYAGDTNHLGSSATQASFTIDKAASSTTINCPSNVTYTGSALEPCSATATGAGGLNVSVTVVYANNTNAGTATADATYAGDTNHLGSSATQASFTIDKAASSTTINCPSNVTYTGSALEPCTATATGVGGLNVSVTVVYANNTNAGTATADASYAGDTNHNGSSATQVSFTIDKAASSTTINCPSNVTYTGSALEPCTATATGAGGLNVSVTVVYANNTNAGTATADASYAGDTNHNGSSATQVSFTIDKAASSTTINCPSNVTYTGSALEPCTATATGAGGLNVSVTVVYANNTNAGTATADASFAGDTNHNGSSATQVSFTIDKAASSTTINCPSNVTYTGSALEPCTATATGAGGLNVSVNVVYANNTNAGTATADASYSGDTNHNGSSATQVSFTIDKAASSTTINCPSNVTYTGSALEPCSATATGAGGLNVSVTVVYANNTNAGTATADATYAGDTNHLSSSATQASFTIDKAASSTTINCPSNVTYTGSALEPCTATATGAGGLNVSVTVVYANNTNAGTATADASYAGDTNHDSSTATQVSFTIDKAASTATVTCPSNVTYTGSALEPCSAAVTGAGGLNLSLTVNYTNNTNAGTANASASFAGDANHNNSSDATNFTIDKASSTTTVTCAAGPFTYTGVAQTPCTADVTGAGGLNQSLTVNYTNNTNAGEATASASYSGDANHNNSNDSKTFTIDKAPLSVTADNKSMLFGSVTPPVLTASYSGFVAGQNVSNLGGSLTTTVKTLPLPGVLQTVNASTPVGTYAIIPGGLTSNNYQITFSDTGRLTVGAWTITGFYQPVDMNVGTMFILNTVKGGSTVPLKFNIYAGTPGPLTERKTVADVMFGSIQVAAYDCATTPGYESPVDVSNTGNTNLRYDTTGAQFIQNWQTPKAPNKCYQVRMTALDGSHIDAFFKTK